MPAKTKKKASVVKKSRSTAVHKSKSTTRRAKTSKKGLMSRIHNMNGFGYAAVLIVIALVGVSVMAINSNASAKAIKQPKSLCQISISPQDILSNATASFNVTITNNSTTTLSASSPVNLIEKFPGQVASSNPIAGQLFGSGTLSPGGTDTYSLQALDLPPNYSSVAVAIKSTDPVFTCKRVVVRQVTDLTNLGSTKDTYTVNNVNPVSTTETIYACVDKKSSKTQDTVNAFEVSSPGVPQQDGTVQAGSGTLYNLSAIPPVATPQVIDSSTIISQNYNNNWDSTLYPTLSELITTVTVPVPSDSGSYVGYQATPLTNSVTGPYINPTNAVVPLSKLKSC